MLVERLKVKTLPFTDSTRTLTNMGNQEPDTSLYKPALEAIKNFIKTSTSSMTAVPKPLKFLRPHYDELTTLYEEWPAGADKVNIPNKFNQSSANSATERSGRCLICSWYDPR